MGTHSPRDTDTAQDTPRPIPIPPPRPVIMRGFSHILVLVLGLLALLAAVVPASACSKPCPPCKQCEYVRDREVCRKVPRGTPCDSSGGHGPPDGYCTRKAYCNQYDD